MHMWLEDEDTKEAEIFIQEILNDSTDPHNIFTPFALCKEVVNKIPSLDGKILVVANLEFIYTLWQEDVELSNVHFATPCKLKAERAALLINENNIFICTGVLNNEGLQNMKFDVVIGNPPYQDDSNGSKNTIYQLFYKHIITNIVQPQGYVALITPTPMLKGLAGGKVDKIKMPPQQQVVLVNLSDIKAKYFKNTGSSFCYFIVKNEKTTADTIIETDGDTITLPFTGIVPQSNKLTLAFSIMDKCFSGKNLYKCTTSDCGKASKKSDTGNNKVIRTINADGTTNTYNVNLHKPHRFLNTPKVMITIMGKKHLIDYSHNLLSGSDHLMATIPTKSDSESESLVSIFQSSLELVHTKFTSESKDQYYSFIKHLSSIPLTHLWTDKELYKHFNLTNDEIQLIEDTIK